MTTKKKHKKIPSTTKSQILSEALLPGCLISNLAKSYGVSRQIIYSWRKDYKTIKSKASAKTEAEAVRASSVIQTQVKAQVKAQSQTLALDHNSRTPIDSCESLESLDGSQNDGSQFVELLIQDSGGLDLKKASLIFSDFALTLEGRVKSSSLVAILKILEGEVITC